jgi:hypothetical protein
MAQLSLCLRRTIFSRSDTEGFIRRSDASSKEVLSSLHINSFRSSYCIHSASYGAKVESRVFAQEVALSTLTVTVIRESCFVY